MCLSATVECVVSAAYINVIQTDRLRNNQHLFDCLIEYSRRSIRLQTHHTVAPIHCIMPGVDAVIRAADTADARQARQMQYNRHRDERTIFICASPLIQTHTHTL